MDNIINRIFWFLNPIYACKERFVTWAKLFFSGYLKPNFESLFCNYYHTCRLSKSKNYHKTTRTIKNCFIDTAVDGGYWCGLCSRARQYCFIAFCFGSLLCLYYFKNNYLISKNVSLVTHSHLIYQFRLLKHALHEYLH